MDNNSRRRAHPGPIGRGRTTSRTTGPTIGRSRRAAGLALVALTLVLSAPAVAAAAAPPIASVARASAAEPAQLSITIDDGRPSATAGDTLGYTITVTNLGTAPVAALRISQTIPVGLGFVSADPTASTSADQVVWAVDLAPSASTELHTTMTVSATPDEVLRSATVACASESATAAPIVCASDSDQLPAGAAAEASAATDQVASRTPSSSGAASWVAVVGVALAVLLIGGCVAWLLLRRRPRRAA